MAGFYVTENRAGNKKRLSLSLTNQIRVHIIYTVILGKIPTAVSIPRNCINHNLRFAVACSQLDGYLANIYLSEILEKLCEVFLTN
jgi:hypothetical protein